MTDDYELWTAHRYGPMFGQPDTKLKDAMTADEVREQLLLDHGYLLHNLLVVRGVESTRANKWLEANRGEG